jgi:hypothetical protein
MQYTFRSRIPERESIDPISTGSSSLCSPPKIKAWEWAFPFATRLSGATMGRFRCRRATVEVRFFTLNCQSRTRWLRAAMGQQFACRLPGCHGRNPSDSCRNYPRVVTQPRATSRREQVRQKVCAVARFIRSPRRREQAAMAEPVDPASSPS